MSRPTILIVISRRLSELVEAVEAELSELLVELAESVPHTPALVQVSPLAHLPSLLPCRWSKQWL